MTPKHRQDPLAEPPEGDFTEARPAPGRRPARTPWTDISRRRADAAPDAATPPPPPPPPGRVGHRGAPPVSWRTQALRSARRLHGLDLARFLALAGMMAVHVWADAIDDRGLGGFIGTVVAGNAAAVFAFLAGITLIFLSGGSRGARGRDLQRARVGIAVRAVMLLVIGLGLNLIDFPAYDILPYYAMLFLLAIPLLGLGPAALALCAVAALLTGPVLRMVLVSTGTPVPDFDPTLISLFTRPGPTLVQLFVTGTYPAITWMAYVCAGMAAARLNLFDRQRQAFVAVGGLAAAGVSAGLSWAALHVWDGRERIAEVTGIRPDLVELRASRGLSAEMLSTTPWWLAARGPHLDTPLSTLHAVGMAAAVVGFVLVLTSGLMRPDGSLPAWTEPLRAAGSMSLTVYVSHLLLLTVPGWEEWRGWFFVGQLVLLVSFATLWRRVSAQGPLETVVSRVPKAVARALVPGRATRAGQDYEPLEATDPR
ncbi:putative membrane protein YeiB [Micrococcus sp. 140720015-1]